MSRSGEGRGDPDYRHSFVNIKRRYLIAEWMTEALGQHHFAVELDDSDGRVVGLLVNSINRWVVVLR